MPDHALDARSPALSPRRARVELALFALTAAFLVCVSLSPLRSGFADAPDRGPGDIALYRGEIDRMHAGQSYYDAAGDELRSRGYPTRSVFNWRTPLPVWLMAQLPGIEWSKCLFSAAGLLLIVLSFRLLVDDNGPTQGLLGVVLLCGALLPCILGELLVMSELWSGVLIALSAVALGLGKRRLGIASGLAALVFRELAAPYVLVCLALAAYERRWRELGAWMLGLAAYAVFFAFHASQVLARVSPADHAHTSSWLCFGGAGFLISTVQMNAFLLVAPQWLTAIYLACVLLGAATWNAPQGRVIVLATAAYAIAFSMVGHDFNQYWGSMTAPLACLCACRAPWSLAFLGRAALAAGSCAARRSASLAG